MDDFGDAGSKLNTMISNLSAQVQESSTRVDSLKKITEKLVPEHELESLSHKPQHPRKPGPSLIHTLENERLRLIMDIQKQEFLKGKLMELLNHNSEVISSVREYLENKPTMIKDDYAVINERADHYWKLVEPKLVALDVNNARMADSFKAIEQLVKDIDMRDIDEVKVKEIVAKLDALCHFS